MLGNEARCNGNLILEIFHEEDVEAILSILIRRNQREDVPSWKPDAKGIFWLKMLMKSLIQAI